MRFAVPSLVTDSSPSDSCSDSAGDAPTRVAPREGAIGSLVACKYRIDREIGRGGMGVVLAAWHLQLEQPVAMKLMSEAAARDPEATARFIREGKLAARLRSDHVARVLDVGTLASGEPFMVMELLDGKDLGALLAASGPLPVEDAVDWLLQALEAIAEAHVLGIVHRDIKPSNLVLTRQRDGTPHIKVLDFGLSKSLDEGPAQVALTRSIAGALGSPQYMAPEQVRSSRSVSPASDQWSSAVTLFELLTDGAPFTGDSLSSLLAAIVVDPPRTVRSRGRVVPSGLEAAIGRALSKDPADRFRDVAAWAAAIAPFGTRAGRESAARIAATLSSGAVPGAVPLPGLAGPRGGPTARRVATGLAVAAAACIAAVTIAGLREPRGESMVLLPTEVEAPPSPAEPAPQGGARPEPRREPEPTSAPRVEPADEHGATAPSAERLRTTPNHRTEPPSRPTPATPPPQATPPPSGRTVEDLVQKGRR